MADTGGSSRQPIAVFDRDAVIREERRRLDDRRTQRRRAATTADAAARHAPLTDTNGPIGLALSGGGIRSAATSLGALQALNASGRLDGFDYLSTVSGGGYIGATLTAAWTRKDANNDTVKGRDAAVFGQDISDNDVVGHLRNHSSYLVPRHQTALRNGGEALVVILRGLVANLVSVAAVLLLLVLATGGAYALFAISPQPATAYWLAWMPAGATLLLAATLLLWAVIRSRETSTPSLNGDTAGWMLRVAYSVWIAVALVFIARLQVPAIDWMYLWMCAGARLTWSWLPPVLAAMVVLLFYTKLDRFLAATARDKTVKTRSLRLLTHVGLVLAALVVPVLLWLVYLALCAWLIHPLPDWWLAPRERWILVGCAGAGAAIVLCLLDANKYSLHRLYRDRLSQAFISIPRQDAAPTGQNEAPRVPVPRLSELSNARGPYPIINAAINLNGSLAANKLGRNAGFFIFTPLHVGCETTGYVATETMEAADPALDLGTAIAISGAAVSSNMGSAGHALLAPTLALLNVRLGYALPNPKRLDDVLRPAPAGAPTANAPTQASPWRRRWIGPWPRIAFLRQEIVGALNEDSPWVYLTDGGHIENLGIYALLQRRCRLIVAVDAEADPERALGSLLKLERYARIDLGVRIVLPWEEIATQCLATAARRADRSAPRDKGPHIAVGRIAYPAIAKASGAKEGGAKDGGAKDEGEQPAFDGVLVYVKSSLTGDEKDYILDYARRYPSFPHETTLDQMFSEEQFEMYRGLGFHMMEGLFKPDIPISVTGDETTGFKTQADARAAVDRLLPGPGPA